MARETQKTEVARWHDRITTATRWRDRKAESAGWNRFIRQYRGEYDVYLGSGQKKFKAPVINSVFSYVQTDIAYLYFKDPYIAVRPTKNSTVHGAFLTEQAVNYFWRKLDQKSEQESQILDANLVGHAWNKDGYYTKASKTPDGNIQISEESMYSMKVSWRDIVFNIGSRRPPYDSLWIAHRIVKPLSEIKSQFPAASDMIGSRNPHVTDDDVRNSTFKDDIDFGVIYEVWDCQKRQVFMIGEGLDVYLRKPKPWPEYYSRAPFNMLWWYENPDETYPLAPISIIEAQILEEIKLLAQALNHVKRFNRQLLYKGNLMTEEEMDKFEAGNDGAMIRCETQGSLQDSIKAVDFGQLPTDIYMILDRIRMLKSSLSGQPEFQQGGMTKTGSRTLGELERIESGANKRTEKRVDRLETHIENIAKNIIAHMQANFDVSQMVKITGETPEEIVKAFGDKYDPTTKTITFTKEDIQGEYDIEVRAGSTLPMNKEVRMTTLREVLELALKTSGPLPEFARVIIMELLKDYQLPQLRQAFEDDQKMAAESAAKKSGEMSIGAAKVAAETEKRSAQAHQINLENALMEAQLQMPMRLMQETEQGIVPQEEAQAVAQ